MFFNLCHEFNILFQYENLIEEFKLIHKETETVKNSGYSVGELKSDMEAMEKERDIVLNRIQQVKRKVTFMIPLSMTVSIVACFY